MCGIEYGKCDICGNEAQLERTYFTYPFKCSCCGGNHFEVVCHCDKCVPTLPVEIHPYFKALDGKEYRSNITNILPIEIRGGYIIDKAVIKEGGLGI